MRERHMGHSAGRTGGLDLIVLLEALQPLPQARASAEQDRDHHDVHVVHKPRSEEVADCCGRRGHQIVWRSTLNRRTATHALWWAVVGIVEVSRKRLQLLISQDPFDQRGWPADVG